MNGPHADTAGRAPPPRGRHTKARLAVNEPGHLNRTEIEVPDSMPLDTKRITPGEWYVHEIDSRVPFPFEVRAAAGTAYRTVALFRSLTHDRHDAQVVAAAPALLAALQEALDQTEDGMHQSACGVDGCWVELAQATIAKATGTAS